MSLRYGKRAHTEFHLPKEIKVMKKLIPLILSSLLLVTSFTGCGNRVTNEYYDAHFFGFDTYITLRFAKEDADGKAISEEYLKNTADECAAILNDIDLLLSAHNEDSQIYALNREINMMVDSSGELLSVLDTAYTISELTNGAYDPTLGDLVELWNVSDGGPVPEDVEIMESLLHTGTDKIVVKGNTISKVDSLTKIDFGGVGKGYATQELLKYLSTTDIPYGLVSLGGNIGVFGTKEDGETYKVGIKDPNDPEGIIGYLYLSNGFLSVSGDYERYFEEDGVRYHHIIDPVTGYPAESGLRSVACVSSNGAAADALSTALFVMGEEEALKLYEDGTLVFEAIFVTDANEIILTDGLMKNGSFELTNDNYTIFGAPAENN
ncbi:MAG: FAD:protein FMN transferase [Ruminococcaceae bacterium]|nr:FAD:protein FMN transferase [Oscillospiraceae bacterium]